MREFLLLFTLFFLGCNKPKEVPLEYYVISKQDSINKKSDIPPPPPPQRYKWYSGTVFIFDSNNKVYLYQTENITRFIRNDKDNKYIYEYKYPNYIGLKPEDLIVFEVNDFVNFLKNNNDIFGLKGFKEDNISSFFYIASDSDTIKNKALFEINKFIEKQNRVSYTIRKTTEEENIALEYKKSKKPFVPKNINWSTNFINGSCKPFTKDYQKLEERIIDFRKAKSTFEKNSLRVFPTL